MKTISLFLALINSITAGLLLLLSFTADGAFRGNTAWLLTKSAAATIVITIGFITWLENIREIKPGLMSVCSVFLVALGVATTIWTYHIGVLTGNMESYLVWFGGSLLFQGISSLIATTGESHDLISS